MSRAHITISGDADGFTGRLALAAKAAERLDWLLAPKHPLDNPERGKLGPQTWEGDQA